MSTISIDDRLNEGLRRARRERLWTAGPGTASLDLRGEALHRLLRHRAPFLLIDAISALDAEPGALAGRRRLDPADPVFVGHFPEHPVYPGVLLIEAMAQLGAALRPLETGGPCETTVATGCRAVFRKPVHPGEELEILAQRVGAHDGLYHRGIAQILRDGEVCAAAIVEGCYV